MMLMITQEQLKDISVRIEKLKSYLEIDKKRIEIANEEEKTANPAFWNDPKKAEGIMKELRFKKRWVEDFEKVISLNEDMQVLYEFYKEEEVDDFTPKGIMPQAQFQTVIGKKHDSEDLLYQAPVVSGDHNDCRNHFGQAFVFCPYCGKELIEKEEHKHS